MWWEECIAAVLIFLGSRGHSILVLLELFESSLVPVALMALVQPLVLNKPVKETNDEEKQREIYLTISSHQKRKKSRGPVTGESAFLDWHEA